MKAKKSYGQHFLKEEFIAERIAKSLSLLDQYEEVVEVGPGMGMLTKYLLDIDKPLTVIEADRDMVEYLNTHYTALHDRIIAEDFLRVKLDQYFKESFAVIGNFPYNISSQILMKVVEYRAQVPEMVGMFQLEVAERVVSGKDSKVYGVISVLVQAFYEAKLLFRVKPGSFNPPPKVQSAVIRLTRRASHTLPCDEILFRKVVKNAFGQRRKMLRNTMKIFLPKELLMEDPFFKNRPENLSVQDYIELTQRITAYRAQKE